MLKLLIYGNIDVEGNLNDTTLDMQNEKKGMWRTTAQI
jgi:hypothetical protein